MASCWIPKPSLCPIAKPAQWTARLRCFPTFSATDGEIPRPLMTHSGHQDAGREEHDG